MLVIRAAIAPSRIHGHGLFAAEPLVAGQTVSRFRPPLDIQIGPEFVACLTPAEQEYLRRFAYRSCYTGLYILTGDHDRFMNHSEAPNVGMNPDGSLTMVALSDIAAGEELTCDYRTFDADWREKLRIP